MSAETILQPTHACSKNSSTEAPISVRHVCRSFDGKKHRKKGQERLLVLDDINLDIKAGEFVSIIGPSGCGKSTLLRIISGLDPATSGEVYMGDELVKGPDQSRGFVFQDASLFPWDDVWHNIAAGFIARKDLKGHEHIIDKYIKMVGLTGFEKAYPKELSGGMAQRVSLARALINHPKVLLLDEPLGALDALTRMTMQEEILRIWHEQETTMIFVTHDVEEAVFMSDRVIVLSSHPGRVFAEVPIDLPRPRDRSNGQYDEYRHVLLNMIHETNASFNAL